MQSKRLTRAETRERTRRCLIDAAAQCITEKGWAAVSVEDIAARAGYTRGAFYSNFSSKRDLFIELLRLEHRKAQESLQARLDAASSAEDIQRQLGALYAPHYVDGGNCLIWVEATLLAIRDTQFREHLAAMYVEKRDMIARFIERLCERSGMTLSGSSADHALAAIALMDGFRSCSMAMPGELPNGSPEAMLGDVFAGMFFRRLR